MTNENILNKKELCAYCSKVLSPRDYEYRENVCHACRHPERDHFENLLFELEQRRAKENERSRR